jgi:hypothetical protein
MEQPLFLDPTIKMEKVAYDTRLDDEPEEWPVSIVRESYKQLPFLKNYETEVEFDKMDTARGFAVGKMLVWPARMQKTAAAERKQLVTVPIVVRNREMSPLDVYTHNDEMKPMDQDKVASILFRPQIVESVAPRNQFTGTNLFGQLTPPNTDHQYNAGTLHKHGAAKTAQASTFWGSPVASPRSRANLGGDVRAQAAATRQKAAVNPSASNALRGGDVVAAQRHLTKKSSALWHAALRTFRPVDVNALAEKLASSPPLRHAFTTTPVLRASMVDIVKHEGMNKSAAARREERLTLTKPTVVQIKEAGKNYAIKTANHHCYVEQVKIASRFDVQKLLPADSFKKLLEEGLVTYTTEPVHGSDVVEKTAQDAAQFGVYRASRSGQGVEGVVVPRMVDFNGRPLDMQVFAGEESHSLQEKVAGVFVRDHVLSSDPPRGLGVFVYQEGPLAVATEPVRIDDKVKVAHEHGSSTTLLGVRMATGVPIRMTVVPGLQKIAMLGEAEVALPETVRFLALRGKQSSVSSSPADAQLQEMPKVAGASSVEVVSDGDFFQLRGSNARAFEHEIMTGDEAEFALCALGLTGGQARGLLKTAASRSTAVAPRTRQVIPEGVAGFEAMTKAASAVKSVPDFRVDLLEELAVLTSTPSGELQKVASITLGKESVDTILSLGFVTPENASLYVNYLPDLEKVSSRLAELLVASRLGMDDVRESAAKNAMTQVNAVVRGLETLRERIH